MPPFNEFFVKVDLFFQYTLSFSALVLKHEIKFDPNLLSLALLI